MLNPIIFNHKYPSDSADYYIVIDEDSNKTVNFKLCKSNPEDKQEGTTFDKITPNIVSELEVDLKALFIPKASFDIYEDNQHCLVHPNQVYASRDGDKIFRSLHQIGDSSKTLANIYFNNSVDECLIICLSCPVLPKDADQPCSNFRATSDAIISVYPEFKNTIDLRNARRLLLSQVDPNDSLSGVEAQLDIVTSLLLALVHSEPEKLALLEEVFPKIHDFEAVFNRTNTMTVKDVDKCLAEIADRKGLMRSLQSAYYQKKREIAGE